jgi:hypothetical protein
VAGNQTAAAQARLRASVRCLESLHGLLKAALEATSNSAAIDLQVGGGCGQTPRRLDRMRMPC